MLSSVIPSCAKRLPISAPVSPFDVSARTAHICWRCVSSKDEIIIHSLNRFQVLRNVRVEKEYRQGRRRPHRQLRMTFFQANVLDGLTMSSAVGIPKFCQMMADGTEVIQQDGDRLLR